MDDNTVRGEAAEPQDNESDSGESEDSKKPVRIYLPPT